MKISSILFISTIAFIYVINESNASGADYKRSSLVSARIANSYNEHLERHVRDMEVKAAAPAAATTKSTTLKTTTLKTTTLKTTTLKTTTLKTTTLKPTTTAKLLVFCPFNPNLICNVSSKYRTFDGTCNNLKNPLYGAANTPYKRFITSPKYGDGLNSPRSLSVSGAPLPNPRLISTSIFKEAIASEKRWFMMSAIFGQFMVHDMTSLATASDSNGNSLSCPCGSTDPNCLNIAIPQGDTAMGGGQSCVQFTRSSPSFQSVDCLNQTYREQLNQVSSYLDLSQVYGSSKAVSDSLRTFTNGQLLTSAGLTANRPYLPKSSTVQCSTDANSQFTCFQAGEARADENLGLTGIHTLFMREHNRIALQLASLNPSWSDDTLFYETRRILQGVYHHIIFSQWIKSTVSCGNDPVLNNPDAFNNTFWGGYNDTINGQLYNEYAGAVMRFGHSNIADIFNRSDSNGNIMPGSGLKFSSMNFLVQEAYNTNKNGIESILLGLLFSMTPLTTLNMADSLQNHLFQSPNFASNMQIDLAATNINRGRDHGYPSFVNFRNFCGLGLAKTFDDLKTTMPISSIQKLQSVYSNVADIDLWVGGLAEGAFLDSKNRLNNTFRSGGSVVGDTFQCLLKLQFSELKRSDRFYYENAPNAKKGTVSTAFTLAQLGAIRNVTLSNLVCSNFDVAGVRPYLFVNPTGNTTNNIIPCSLYKSIDLSPWKV